MTDHMLSFPLMPDEPTPLPKVGDKVTAMSDDGVSVMYVVEAEPLPDGGVRLRFGSDAPAEAGDAQVTHAEKQESPDPLGPGL